MSETVSLTVRGRGTRSYAIDQSLLISENGDGVPAEVKAGAVKPGDYLGVTYGGSWPTAPAPVPQPPKRVIRGSEKAIRIPEVVTEDLALFLGAYFSEVHRNLSNWTVVITNSVDSVLQAVQRACFETFGLQGRITHQAGKCPGFVVASKRLVEFLALLGCGGRSSEKRVPTVISGSTRELVLAFLQGAALDAYASCSGGTGRWAICLDSCGAIDDLQDLVTRIGVVNAQISKWNKDYQKYYFELYASGHAAQDLSRLVPFLEPDKASRAEVLQQKQITDGNWTDVIPGVRGRDLYDLIPVGRGGRGNKGTGRQQFRHLRDDRTRHITRRSIVQAASAGAELPEWMLEIVTSTVRFSPVTSVNAV